MTSDNGAVSGGPVIGVDVGTSSVKAALVDRDGRVLSTAAVGGAHFRTASGVHERDPEDWWSEVTDAVRAVTAGSDEHVAALAITGQMLGVVPVDDEGRSVRPAILWADARADAQARRLVRRFLGPVALRVLGGGVPTGKDVVPKLLWLAEHEPQHHGRTAAYLDVVGHVVLRATGMAVMEHSAASATGLLGRRDRQWSPTFARAVSVDPGRLPPLVAATDVAGTVSAVAAADLGLPVGTPVIAAGGDAIAATVGAGARPMIQVGTSGWVSHVADRRPRIPPDGVASLCWPEPRHDLVIAVSESVSPCLSWITHLLYGRTDVVGMELLDREVAGAEPGASGMIFAPWLIGERSPINDPDVRGGLLNIGPEHGRPELARAVMEGIGHNMRWMLDRVGPPVGKPIRIGGGVAQSDAFVQVLADVTGRSIERVAVPGYSTAVGAALIGLVATGQLGDMAAAGACVHVDRRFEPSASSGHFDVADRAFRRLPRVLRPLHRSLSAGSAVRRRDPSRSVDR